MFLRVFVTLTLVVGCVMAQCPHQDGGLTRWSSAVSTGAGGTVTVGAGQRLLFDLPASPLYQHVYIDGEVVFDMAISSLELHSYGVTVRTPLTHTHTHTLPSSHSLPHNPTHYPSTHTPSHTTLHTTPHTPSKKTLHLTKRNFFPTHPPLNTHDNHTYRSGRVES